ncbi:SRPBCC family protein [Nocardia sp. NPDC052566]|uniref:SRPBCC family protein n=1 Tax=Nocardia sp. NPDC052566 TaxID=3364330 RepID=UPI0037C9F908
MATVTREIIVAANPAEVWAIIGDFADGPSRMAPGFVTETTVRAPGLRVATFADGTVLEERLITLDDAERRFVYSIVGGSVTPEHNNASMQVFDEGDGQSRFVWRHDVLPAALADAFAPKMEQGLAVFKRTVEAAAASRD